ncbi:MAG TPA: hypothetical protein VGZ47_12800 [Gemmataceae bacterium]|jgi:hypothetical protein|nr:hypothetical protein [Gemmataceae bacterium]
MAPHLRLFCEPESSELGSPPATVAIRLGDLLPLLSTAHRFQFQWLCDFANDEIRITEDLYHVLQEFNGFRPSA